MTRGRLTLLGSALVILTAVVLFAGCSKDKSTNPVTTAAKELNSAHLAQNDTYVHAIATAGTYAYHCSIHTTMHGSVTVSSMSSNTTQSVNISGFAFSPASVTIAPGGTVTWTNLDGTAHTVTSD
jgi:plastocyanin